MKLEGGGFLLVLEAVNRLHEETPKGKFPKSVDAMGCGNFCLWQQAIFEFLSET
jgi:hypothetical protein